MRQTLTTLVVIMLACIAKSQTVFDSFDTIIDSNYSTNLLGVNDSSRINPFEEYKIVSEGQGALRLEYKVELAEAWGGFATLQLRHPDSTGLWNFSGYDSLSFSFYNKVPCNFRSETQLRIILYDASNVDDLAGTSLSGTEWWYSFIRVLENDSGWNKIVIPLKDIGSAAADGYGSNGFWLTGLDGITGNYTFDLDKIRGIGIEVFAQDTIHSDHGGIAQGEFILDNLELIGNLTSVSNTENIPERFILNQNYPNPFNPVTRITYTVPATSNISLVVYDVSGREIKTLVNGVETPGNYTVQFDGTDLSSGVYFYVISANNFIETKKLILLK